MSSCAESLCEVTSSVGAGMTTEVEDVIWVLNFTTEDERTFIRNIRALWQQCKISQQLVSQLEEFFSYPNCNPYLKCLFAMIHSGDLNAIRQGSLCFSVLQIFKEWKKNFDIDAWLTENVQDLAFEVALLMGNSSFVGTFASEFKLDKCGKRFMPRLRKVLASKKFKLVGQWAIILKLSDQFTVNELVVPLYTLDRIQLVENLIDAAPNLVNPFLGFLDSLLAPCSSPRATIQDFYANNGLLDLLGSISDRASLTSAVAKYMKNLLDKYPNASSRHLENYKSMQIRKRMGFLLHTRYQTNTMSDQTMHELLITLMEGQSDQLKEDLVYKLVEYGNTANALFWANTISKPLHSNLQSLVDSLLLEEPTSDPPWLKCDEDNDECQNIYSLSIPESCIVLVETSEQFQDALEEVKACYFLGVDSEWNPFQVEEDLSLVQLAVPNKVFILDATRLISGCSDLWKTLVLEIICNPNIIKCGFSLSCDFRNWYCYLGYSFEAQGIFDLKILLQLISSGNIQIQLPYANEEDKHKNSLSQVVFNCFGKHLKKAERFSEWSWRPLDPAKLNYAALDAYVLIEIYQCLMEVCEKSGVFLDDVVSMVVDNFDHPNKKNTKKKKRKKKKPAINSLSNSSGTEPISTKEPSGKDVFKTFHVIDYSSGRKPSVGVSNQPGPSKNTPPANFSSGQVVPEALPGYDTYDDCDIFENFELF